jgi:hypothetical protein
MKFANASIIGVCFTALTLAPWAAPFADATQRAYGSQTISLRIDAPAGTALAAFTPVAEARWNPGWVPIFSRPDHPNDQGSVFTTSAKSQQVIWLLERYDRSHGAICYLEVQPGRTLTRIAIVVKSLSTRRSLAMLTYDRTSLSVAGDGDVRRFVAHFSSQRAHWEHVLNDFVASSQRR